MSGVVVIRCPNCGTTQSTLGECEACHDADVRYYCANHTPGRWLDVPYCTACGASVTSAPGRPASAPPPPPPSRRSDAPPSWAPPGEPPRRAPPPPPPRRSRRERPPERPVDSPRFEPPPFERPPERRGARESATPRMPPSLRDLMRRTRVPPPAPAAPPPPGIDLSVAVAAGKGIASAVGCVAKAVAIAIIVGIILLVLSFSGFSLVEGPVRDWGTDVAQRAGVLEGTPEQTRRGIEAYRAGDMPTAERELREAAQAYPRSALALIYLGRLRSDAGDYTRAAEYLREATRREPESALAHRELAGYHLMRAQRWRSDPVREPFADDELQQAERLYSRALMLAPGDRQARGYYACVLTALDRRDEAAVELRAAGDGPWTECSR